MQIPDLLLQSLSNISGFDKAAFEKTHELGAQVTSVRLNAAKPSAALFPELTTTRVPWAEQGYYLSARPSFTFDPLFHGGCYYVQEASSMFLEQALVQTMDLSAPLRVLDLCAAPGGKSTHLQSLLTADSLLVSNEVIRSRVNILKDNIIKWGCRNVAVTHNDPRDFARLENYFDIIVVDAPCSGSGLFRREPEAMGEWSPDNVALCSQRQQRILADVWPALKGNGLLVYSTCSYSKEEDEDIGDWIVRSLGAEPLSLDRKEEWNIVEVCGETGACGYRFWPDKVQGEGFFLSCFRKRDGGLTGTLKKKIKTKPAELGKKDRPGVLKWLNTEDLFFLQHEQTVYAWPSALEEDYNWLLNNMRLIYSGTIIGDLIRDKLIPAHAFAMAGLVHASVEKVELGYDQAISYLQRKDFSLQVLKKGWQMVSYQEQALGWINSLSNRINNYYPKELRILKDRIL